MDGLNISLLLDSPILAGELRRGDVYQSFDYVAGSVIRGAVASVLMQKWSPAERGKPHPEECPDQASCDFCRVLYPLQGEPPRFFDCYPAMPGDTSVRPLPATARTCKRHGGFIRPDDPEPDHGVFDTLVAQVAARDAAAGGTVSPYPYQATCPVCDEGLAPPKPAYYGLWNNSFYAAQPVGRRFSRTAINRRRHTAQRAMLFTLSVMGEQMRTGLPEPAPALAVTHLHGLILPGGADRPLLDSALQNLGSLGSGRSRGLGALAKVRSTKTKAREDMTAEAFLSQVSAGEFQPSGSGFFSRLASFNQTMAAERAFYAAMDVTIFPGRWYFTIDLLSETFVRDGGWATLRLRPELLGLHGARLEFAFAEALERGGWSNATGLPRRRQIGIAPGGGFLYSVTSGDPQSDRDLLARLAQLEDEGIGDDRVRGAGRLQVCAPFHKEVEPK